MYDNKQMQSAAALAVKAKLERPIGDDETALICAEFGRTQRAALAVSGGADSMALLHLAARWRQIASNVATEFHVLTVDHGLRPEARREAQLVAEAAVSYGMHPVILSWRGRKPTSRLQDAARIARYDLMADYCSKRGIGPLATAHHLDDQAETVLMRLARGSGVDGLAAIPKETIWAGVQVIRPLLDLPKSRLVATLEVAGQSWTDDPTNQCDAFERNRVRATMVKLNSLGFDAGRLALTARRMRRAQEALDESTDRFLNRSLTLYEAGICAMALERLEGAPNEIALRALSRILMAVGGRTTAPRLMRLESLLAALKGRKSKARTLAGCRIVISGGRMCVFREYGRNGYPELTMRPGSEGLWDRRFRVYLDRDSATPLTVRALGGSEFAALRREHDLARDCSSAIGSGLVSFWSGDDLISVPHLGFHADPGLWGRQSRASKSPVYGAQFVNAELVAQKKMAAGAA